LSRPKLIKQLKEKNPQLNHSELMSVLNIFSESILKALKDQKTVHIKGIGRWYLKKLKENFNSRNPATSELIYKPERVKVRFKASKKLIKLINE
jgi:nucleoid DNA-binding protein